MRLQWQVSFQLKGMITSLSWFGSHIVPALHPASETLHSASAKCRKDSKDCLASISFEAGGSLVIANASMSCAEGMKLLGAPNKPLRLCYTHSQPANNVLLTGPDKILPHRKDDRKCSGYSYTAGLRCKKPFYGVRIALASTFAVPILLFLLSTFLLLCMYCAKQYERRHMVLPESTIELVPP